MGTVYLAVDPRLDRKIALKLLHADDAGSGSAAMLLREARAASALSHPNICQIYDISSDDPPWIAMEYVEGRSLADAVPAEGLPPAEVVRIAQATASALAHAHERGVLHRDLKPANIVCDAEGRPKVLDFGIASRLPQAAAAALTRTMTLPEPPALAGSLPYMAPEVLRGAAADQRSDLWSFGVLLYELLAGRRPFTGDTLELVSHILESTPAALPSRVPTPLARIVRRLLSKTPADRYASAAQVAVDLDGISRHERQAPAGRSAAILALAAVVIGGAGMLIWRTTRFQPLVASEHRLVSSGDESHRAPSFSPDGAMLAVLVPDASGVPQIVVKDLRRGSSLQITRGEPGAGRPRWSPTGDQIVYHVPGQGIWSASPLGGASRRILTSGVNPNVSADGTRLVFEDGREIWTSGADGSDRRKVEGTTPLYYGIPRGPAFSPDGTEIVFFQAEIGPNGDLWIMPSAGGNPRQLTFDRREGGWPAWTPDGEAIIYSSARAGSRTLWQVPAAGGEPVAFTSGAGEDDQPDISASGRQVAYTNVRNTWDLRLRDLASGAERSLMQRGLELLFPTFSPDGRRLVFFGRADYAVAIFTIDADGSNLRQLTAGRDLNHQPRWGSDGADIYFYQVVPEQSLRRMPTPGGPSEAFRHWEWITENSAQFDPTGRFIAYQRQPPLGAPAGAQALVIHEIATRIEREWPDAQVRPGGWSPDGRHVVGQTRDGHVVLCSIADERCRTLTTGAQPVWPGGSDRIYFARPANSAAPQSLWSIGADGTDARLEAEMGAFRPIDRFFTVSRDGKAAWSRFEAGRHDVWTATVR